MPFRTRMKRVFGHSGSSASSSTTVSSTPEPRLDYRNDSTVYKPGEWMPTPKYRMPASREHKAHLEKFSFGAVTEKLTRTISGSSNYSPMGTRLPSRSASLKSARNAASRRASRNNSFQGNSEGKFGGTEVERVAEGQDEPGDVANVGLSSRRASLKTSLQPASQKVKAKELDTKLANENPPLPTIETAKDHTPFTEDDVNKILEKEK